MLLLFAETVAYNAVSAVARRVVMAMLGVALAVSACPGRHVDGEGGGEGEGEGEGDGEARLALSRTSYHFGSACVGGSGQCGGQVAPDLDATVTNEGTAPSTNIEAATDAASFEIVATTCGVLAPGASCTITVRFVPQSPGAAAATLTASVASGGVATASLTGTGTSCDTITSISPGGFTFDDTLVGASSGPASFTVSNWGPRSNTCTTTLTGADATSFTITNDGCASGLAGGGACVVEVQFTPASVGAKSAALQSDCRPCGITSSAFLSGTAQGEARLTLSPTLLNFGSACPGAYGPCGGQVAPDFDATVTNEGSAPSTGIEAATDAASFVIVGTTCDVLAPAASCAVTVRFAPVTSGAAMATLSVAATAGGVATASLSGAALSCDAITSISPSGFAFDDTLVGASSAPASFTVSNWGTRSNTCTTTLTGADATSFTITNDGCVSGLAGGDECVVELQFTPASVGAKSAALRSDCTPCGIINEAFLTGTAL